MSEEASLRGQDQQVVRDKTWKQLIQRVSVSWIINHVPKRNEALADT